MSRVLTARPERTATSTETPAAVASTSPGVLGIVLMTAAAATWTVVIGGLAVWRHNQFLSHRFDLGNMVQAVWSTTHGRPLEVTDGATGEQIVRLAAHVDPILVLLAPVWWIHPQPETLIVVQAAALASGIYPVARLAMKYVGHPLAAALLGAWYLGFPWVVWNAFDDFHPVTLAIPLLLYAIWFLDEHRLGLFAVCAALALLTGELIGLTVGALGIWYAIRYGRVRIGSTIAVAGAAWTVFCLLVVIPAFNNGNTSRFYGRYESVGGSPAGVVRTAFTDPGAILAEVATSGSLVYVAWLLLPTALLALGAPLLLLSSTPAFAINVLSDFPSMTQPRFHYGAAIVPILVAAAVVSLGRLAERLRMVGAAALLGTGMVVLAANLPAPGAHDYLFQRVESSSRAAVMRDAIGLVPSGAPVMATNRLGAHLSARREIRLVPNIGSVRWAVLDLNDPVIDETSLDVAAFDRVLDQLRSGSAWHLVFDRENVRVYRKVT